MLFETRVCTGCQTCELACSYHHTGAFSSSASSIEIVGKPKELGFAVMLHEKSADGHHACDGCLSEVEPLCIRYCPTIAQPELNGIIQQIRRQSVE